MTNSGFPTDLAPEITKEFVEILKCVTDTPDHILITGAVSVLGVLSGPLVKLPGGKYLNDFFLIVGKSGISRKTTAQSWARRLLKDVIAKREDLAPIANQNDTGDTKGSRFFYPVQNITQFSVEGLEEACAGQGVSLLLSPREYREVFAIASRQGQSNTIRVLTAMWDCGPIKSQFISRRATAESYTLGILGCSTLSWLRDAFTSESIAGGFLNRHLVTISEGPDAPLANQAELDEAAWDKLVTKIAKLVPTREFEKIDSELKLISKAKTLRLEPGQAMKLWTD